MVDSLGACITEPTPRVCPIIKNASLKVSSEKALISAATINPSVSTLNAVLLNH